MAAKMNMVATKARLIGAPAIRVEGVSKAFSLAKPKKAGGWSVAWRRPAEPESLFWALKDVSFEVGAGRGLGILGLNGAGKSTLLKIIAGTLQPTNGSLHVNGRVQLLQLGAGFVPELTGRQNVVAHARARGISSDEIEQRIAFVEAFADIGQFFDQPMRMYSSGMQGRVAFGNAFAVQPEILIVDEALAVGDAVFANKCFRKIQEMRERGTTILFTSHSTDAVLRFCEDGIVLHKGELVASGTARDAVKAYSALILGNAADAISGTSDVENSAAASEAMPEPVDSSIKDQTSHASTPSVRSFAFAHADGKDRMAGSPLYNRHETIFGKGGARIVECKIFVDGEVCKHKVVPLGAKIELYVRAFFDEEINNANFGFTVSDGKGLVFYGTNQLWLGQALSSVEAHSDRTYRIAFPANMASGDWFVSPAIAEDLTVLQQREAAIHIQLAEVQRCYIGSGWLDLEFGEVAKSAADSTNKLKP